MAVFSSSWPLFIQTNQFTAGTETRVDSHYTFFDQAVRSISKLAGILGKNTDSFFIGFLFGEQAHFGFHRWFQQTFVTIGNS
jgi:hypothetical protein